MELVKIYFKKLNKIAITTNFLAFSSLFEKFSFLDPDRQIECGSGRDNECGSRSTALTGSIGNVIFFDSLTWEASSGPGDICFRTQLVLVCSVMVMQLYK